MERIRRFFNRVLLHYSFHNLLVWLFFYLVAGPFVKGRYAQITLSIGISLVLFFAVYAINTRSKLFKYTVTLMGITLVVYWMDLLNILIFLPLTDRLLIIVYLGILIYSFTRYVLTARRVTSRLISAALCLYLLMGTLWGVIYDVVNTLVPGSYKGDLLVNPLTVSERLQHFEYFSFVTLTTLGYGDILPQNAGAAALCQAEAIIGQFFMAVLVARLVGIQVSQQFSSGPEDMKGR